METLLSQCVRAQHKQCPEEVEVEGIFCYCTCDCHLDVEDDGYDEWERFEQERNEGFSHG